MQNPMVHKLKAVKPEPTELYHNHIMFLQDYIETRIQEFKAMMEQRRHDLFEAKRQEDEQRKMLAEQDRRWKQEEEEKRLAVEEAEKKAKEEFLPLFPHHLATQLPNGPSDRRKNPTDGKKSDGRKNLTDQRKK